MKSSPLVEPVMTCSRSLHNHIIITLVSICAWGILIWPECWRKAAWKRIYRTQQRRPNAPVCIFTAGTRCSFNFLPVMMTQQTSSNSSNTKLDQYFKHSTDAIGDKERGLSTEIFLGVVVYSAGIIHIVAGQVKLLEASLLLWLSSYNLIIPL